MRVDLDREAFPERLRACVQPLEVDAEAEAFVARFRERPHGALASLAFGALASVFSDYDAHALLGLYPMHLLSSAQWRALVGGGARLLDVGAGAGFVTERARGLFGEIVTTETSTAMGRRLRARGWTCLPEDLGRAPLDARHGRFEVVSVLNVLDRCAHPRTLLAHAREALADGGRLLVAVPLPLRAHVHVAGGTVDPEELLPAVDAERFEDCAAHLVEHAIEPAGLRVTRISRLPYLSRGDGSAPLHVLDDLVLVCERAG